MLNGDDLNQINLDLGWVEEGEDQKGSTHFSAVVAREVKFGGGRRSTTQDNFFPPDSAAAVAIDRVMEGGEK